MTGRHSISLGVALSKEAECCIWYVIIPKVYNTSRANELLRRGHWNEIGKKKREYNINKSLKSPKMFFLRVYQSPKMFFLRFYHSWAQNVQLGEKQFIWGSEHVNNPSTPPHYNGVEL